MVKKYTIGVDFGTESGRAVLIEVDTGKEIASHVTPYSNGVIDEVLPVGDDIKLEPDWALQDPEDYIRVLSNSIPEVLAQSRINAEDVIGIGIDFTACTMLPIDAKGTPLCMKQEHRTNPHGWVKLWKHHAAQPEANKINEIAQARGEEFLARYGGKISSEWMIAKIWQILDEAPDIYDEAEGFIEAADWVVLQMTAEEKRNSCTAGYKALWNKRKGYPSKEYFKALDPRLENLVEEKLSTDIYPIGSKAGELTKYMAEMTGLKAGTAVAVANVDAHVSMPAVGVVEPGKMLMIMGTSTCHMLLGEEEKNADGMCGVVEDGIISGYFGYEAGQSGVGDIFAWFVDNCVPANYWKEAEERKIDIHELLEEKAAKLEPGESGLLALDWWNGNRSILVDTDLTGMLIGATLLTKPEEIYRALIEATAFGTNIIIESFNNAGVPVNELYACGGLPEKNRMLMQIYADVTNMEIRISASKQTPALGSAMFGAVAAGSNKGGYDSILQASVNMARIKEEVFKPIPDNVETYKRLYDEYKKLHDYFGRRQNNVMKVLKDIKKKAMKGVKEDE